MAYITFTWIDPDSNETVLSDKPNSRVVDYSGLGMAPLSHFLKGIPSQHRQAHRGLKFRPRVAQLSIWDARASAYAQTERQAALLSAFNPDKGEGTLKIVLSGGPLLLEDGDELELEDGDQLLLELELVERYLDCYAQDMDFPSKDRPQWGQQQLYVIRFIARDPLLYDPTQNSESDNLNGATPVDIAVNNSGDMGAYPTIEIAAGAENPKLELVSTGEYIEFASYTVPGGDTLTIDCWAGTIELDDGTSKMSELKKESTLFYLPRGSDTVRLTAAAGANQEVTVKWYDRYLGLGGE